MLKFKKTTLLVERTERRLEMKCIEKIEYMDLIFRPSIVNINLLLTRLVRKHTRKLLCLSFSLSLICPLFSVPLFLCL